MLGGIRGFLSAVAAFASLTANHAYAKGGDKQADAQQSVATSLQHIAARYDQAAERAKGADQQDQPCGPKQYGSHADLCAQWKAADAAADSAWWAWLSSIVGLGSLVGVIVAIGAAFHSNWIARDTAKRQLRAYLTVEPGGVTDHAPDLCGLPYNIVNRGQTPAYGLAIFGQLLVTRGDRPMDFKPGEDGLYGEAEASTDITLGPGHNQWNNAYLPKSICEGHWDAIHSKEEAIIHYGFVEYRDAFDVGRRSYFAFYHWGQELTDADTKRCRFGNSAT